MIAILSSSLVNAKSEVKSEVEKDIVAYVKKAISVNKDFTLKEVRIKDIKELEAIKGWSVYFLDIDLQVIAQNNKIMTVHDKIFSDGKYMTRDFMSLKGQISLKDRMVPDMDSSFYKKDHLIYGDESAKDKIVIFSDPLCPFCQTYMPEVFKAVKANPKKIALYYYHFPLTMIHPEAETIIKATMAAEKKGNKDILMKVYEAKFALKTKDENATLEAFNKKMGTKLTPKEINTQDILVKYSKDLELAGEMMINGTPTVYVNGKKDFSRTKYKKILGIK
jgi:protein-disulfide isomerase